MSETGACTRQEVEVQFGARASKRPCEDCPWRKDVAPGQFPATRYYGPLSMSSGSQGNEAGIGTPMFACHKTAEGKEIVCAGWLAVEGQWSLTARLNAIWHVGEWHWTPEGDWPELFESYDEMAQTQSRWDIDRETAEGMRDAIRRGEWRRF